MNWIISPSIVLCEDREGGQFSNSDTKLPESPKQ